MIITRAPVRISFAGGGTDFPSYYREHGGLVVSTTIDKYFYLFVSLHRPDSVQITSSDYHTFFRVRPGLPALWDGDLALPRAFLHEFGIQAGISLFLASEIPPGTGLGSSSTVSVALCKALSTFRGQRLSRGDIAELASAVEIEKLGAPIGKQDQYAAAFGGLNAIQFHETGPATVTPVRLASQTRQILDRRLLLFFTGSSRSASSILREQQTATQRRDPVALAALHRIKAMAEVTIDLLERGDLDGFGAMLHEAWETKRRLAQGISNPRIDEWYELARANGAAGGKIAGAGGGGFLLLYCREERQDELTAALESAGLVRMDFNFEDGGATVLMDALPRLDAPVHLSSLAAFA